MLDLFTHLPKPLRVLWIACAAFTILIMMAALPALAADGTTVVDVSPLVEILMRSANELLAPILGAVAVAVLGWIGGLIKRKLGVDADRAIVAMNGMLHAGIQRGVDAVEGMTREKLFRDGKPITFDVKSKAVAWVANRMSQYSPDLLKKLGVTETRLRELALEAIMRKQNEGLLVVDGVAAETIGASPAA